MRSTRRGLLQLAGATSVVGLVGTAGGCFDSDRTEGSTGHLLPSAGDPPARFAVPLPVPQVAAPVEQTASADIYRLTAREATAEILPGKKTTIWGYDGTFPGPTIVSRRGRATVVQYRNELPTPTSVHLHGGHTPAESDGYPTDLVLPAGGTSLPTYRDHQDDAAWTFHDQEKTYSYPTEQRAATLWYHDHRMDFTGPQVWRGLVGFHLIHDDEEDALPLPSGDRDIPLMIVDRAFDAEGQLLYPSMDPTLQGEPGVMQEAQIGVLGDTILVNGAPWPVLEVANVRYRFRLLNASNARRYELALDPPPEGGVSFTQVGSDGGLLGAPITHESLQIAQAERFDVVVDFSAYPVGTKVTMANRLGNGATDAVMQFHVVRAENDDSQIPDVLSDMSDFDALDASAATITRKFEFLPKPGDDMIMWEINGQPFDPATPLATPALDSTEVWELFAAPSHPIHLHLVQFKVLSRERTGGKPLAKDAGWKDVVDLTEDDRVRVVARFSGYRGRYLLHCHNLEHEDMAMMARFDVT